MSDVNKSSFIDLQAEVLKKKREAEQARTKDRDTLKVTSKKDFLNKRDNRGQSSLPIPSKRVISFDEADAFAKSQAKLEEKTKLYERLQSGELLMDTDQRETYMVDFDRKGWDEEKQTVVDFTLTENVYNQSPAEFLIKLWNLKEQVNNEKKELIEYVDEFGRTRMIDVNEKRAFDKEQEETRRFLVDLASRCENQIETGHYDATNEIRDKGIGFFSFSTKENERQRQIEALNELRKKTKEARAQSIINREQRRLQYQTRRILLEERKKQLLSNPNSLLTRLLQ